MEFKELSMGSVFYYRREGLAALGLCVCKRYPDNNHDQKYIIHDLIILYSDKPHNNIGSGDLCRMWHLTEDCMSRFVVVDKRYWDIAMKLRSIREECDKVQQMVESPGLEEGLERSNTIYLYSLARVMERIDSEIAAASKVCPKK